MPEEALPSLRLLLTDSDSDVRIFAVNILNGLCHPGMVPCLVEVIATDSHVNVCMAAVDGLAEAGDVEAIPPLAALARRFADVPFVAFAVAAATRRIRGH
ncbi:MAG: HEAT repeat domain-containing protein [Ancalomicrobiaceae bacterium]|nr:HEAT repeat domain-containing protein [Ancalomicrobiaceae bacterium]